MIDAWKRKQRRQRDTSFTLTEQRKAILNALTRYPSLYTSHIHQLYPKQVYYTGVNEQLESLYDYGLLDRDVGPPNLQLRHWLTKEGWALINDREIDIGPEAVNVKRPKGHARLSDYHSRVIIDVVASLEIAAKRKGLPYRLLGTFTAPDPLKISGLIGDEKNAPTERSIEMDGLIEINGNGYAIEVELSSTRTRSQLTGSSFYKKLLVYRDFIVKRRAYKERYGLENMRVLVVTSGPKKQQSWMDFLASKTPQTGAFLFHHFPMLHQTYQTPKPYEDILENWQRVGLPATNLYE